MSKLVQSTMKKKLLKACKKLQIQKSLKSKLLKKNFKVLNEKLLRDEVQPL